MSSCKGNMQLYLTSSTPCMRLQKLEQWKPKAEKENFAMFEALSFVVDGSMDVSLSSEISAHLINLRKAFLIYWYFPKISDVDWKLVRKSLAIQ